MSRSSLAVMPWLNPVHTPAAASQAAIHRLVGNSLRLCGAGDAVYYTHTAGLCILTACCMLRASCTHVVFGRVAQSGAPAAGGCVHHHRLPCVACLLIVISLLAQVTLSGMPLQKGFFIITGCRMTFLTVTWLQPWTPTPRTFGKPSLPCQLLPSAIVSLRATV